MKRGDDSVKRGDDGNSGSNGDSMNLHGGGGCKDDSADVPNVNSGLPCGVAKTVNRKTGSRAAARAIGASATAVAAGTGAAANWLPGSAGQGTKRPAAAAASIPIAVTTGMTTTVAKGNSLRHPKRVKTEEGAECTSTSRVAARAVAHIPGVENGGCKELVVGYGTVQQQKWRGLAVPNVLMRAPVSTSPLPPCAAHSATGLRNGVALEGKGGNILGGQTCSPTVSSFFCGNGSIGYNRSTQDLAPERSAGDGWTAAHAGSGWSNAEYTRLPTGPCAPSAVGQHAGVGSAGQLIHKLERAEDDANEDFFSSSGVSSDTTVDWSRSDEDEANPTSVPPLPSWGALGETTWGSDTDTIMEQAAVMALDDFELESALILDIPETFFLDDRSSSATWPELIGGPCLSTDKAFDAVAVPPSNVSGDW